MMRLIIIVSMKRTILFPFYIPTDSGLRKRSVSTGIDTMPLQRKNVLSILLFVLIVSVLAAKHSGVDARPNDNNVSDKLSGKSNIFVRPKRKAENMCNQYINQIFTKISVLQLVADPTVVTVTSDKCTDSNELVVGGEDATPGEFPHQVSLGILRNGTYTHMCGGSLISPLWVLTAAHCIDSPSPRNVRLGFHSLQNTEGGITATVAEIIRNPDYKSPSVYNDIALIKLDKAVEFSKNIRPACLHVQYDTVPLEAWVTGWGDTEFGEETGSDTLQKAELKILDSIQCISSYRPSTQLPKGITQHMLCAGDPVGGWAKDSCVGDSGGPLQIIHPENRCLFEVFGITSYGQGCAFPNKPGVYTKVSHYIKWIEDIVWP